MLLSVDEKKLQFDTVWLRGWVTRQQGNDMMPHHLRICMISNTIQCKTGCGCWAGAVGLGCGARLWVLGWGCGWVLWLWVGAVAVGVGVG